MKCKYHRDTPSKCNGLYENCWCNRDCCRHHCSFASIDWRIYRHGMAGLHRAATDHRGHFFDVAVRDLVMAIGAFTLAKLTMISGTENIQQAKAMAK